MLDSVALAKALADTGRRCFALFLIHYPGFKGACLVDKGREWKTMHAPSLVDSGIPSDLDTGSSGEPEEEGRLPTVAMTRAKDERRPMLPV